MAAAFVYDTRFFFERYYSKDSAVLGWTKTELASRQTKYVSVITARELYKLTLELEGREVAELRTTLMNNEFEVVAVDLELTKLSARIRSKYRVPLADSVIAVTAQLNGFQCVSDDPHPRQIREIRTRWVR
jgi:predicted nucleic acid-binding protein